MSDYPKYPVYLFRFEDVMYSENRVVLLERALRILRTTRCGHWVDTYAGERFVLTGARKRYACPTREEALESFHARKRRQARILRWQLRRAEVAALLHYNQPELRTAYIQED